VLAYFAAVAGERAKPESFHDTIGVMSPSFREHVDVARSVPRAIGWGALGLVVLSCRTPPPLVHTAPEANASGQASAPAPPPPPPAPAASNAAPPSEPPRPPAPDHAELEARYAGRPALSVLRGEASYYGAAFAGRKTASGEVFDPDLFTAAHRTLRFGTVLRVKRVDTGAVVYVRVNDRGPYGKKRRILDLSTAAASRLDMLKRGIAEIRAEVVERAPAPPSKKKATKTARIESP